MLLLQGCVSAGGGFLSSDGIADVKAANEYAITCQTELALASADRAAQAGGFGGGIGELQRVVFLRDAGRTAEAAQALDARNRRWKASAKEAQDADRAINRSLDKLHNERRTRTGSPQCPPAG